ncbi:MAG: hypothetical protein ABJ178_07050, partial [Marinomonas sp.]
NMFGFYFAIFSALTPPVAVGVLVGARIANAGFLATAFEAGRLGAMALLLPFIFVSFPSLLDPASLTLNGWVAILAFLAASILGAGALYGALSRTLTPNMRGLFFIAGPVMLLGYAATDWLVVGLIPSVALTGWLIFSRRRKALATA